MLAVKNELELFTDVIALSRTRCMRPIAANLAYATRENFIGRVVDGYVPGITDFALLTTGAAEALCKVQNELLQKHNLGLLVYDSCRPKRACIDFKKWSMQLPADDYETERKQIHFPHIEKKDLFPLGYVAEDSQHCYGNTVDLVLIDEHLRELTLGACFDYMDTLSHWTTTEDEIGAEAYKNRHILLAAMEKFDFVPYEKEFWHYSHKEKVIQRPLDFVMSADLKGLNVG